MLILSLKSLTPPTNKCYVSPDEKSRREAVFFVLELFSRTNHCMAPSGAGVLLCPLVTDLQSSNFSIWKISNLPTLEAQPQNPRLIRAPLTFRSPNALLRQLRNLVAHRQCQLD